MRLEDSKMIVTGAAQGLGFHFVQRLVEAGAQVMAGDVNEEGLARLVAACEGAKGKVFTRRLDVASETETGAFVDAAFVFSMRVISLGTLPKDVPEPYVALHRLPTFAA